MTINTWSDSVNTLFGGLKAAVKTVGSVVKGTAEWTFFHTLWLILAVGGVLLLALVLYLIIMKSCKSNEVGNDKIKKESHALICRADKIDEDKPKSKMTSNSPDQSFLSTDIDAISL